MKIYDENGHPVPPGETGRIFVGNDVRFEGYTGGGSKDELDGLLSSGDVGHFDAQGRLFVDGRDDDMIVSGGENVFPAEVEDLLHNHRAVADVAVFGVDDEKFGQRLRAVIVKREGAPAEREGRPGLRQVQPRRLQVPARRRVRGRAPADVDGESAQARARRRLT